MHADFLAIAVNNAHLEVSLNLGKERSWDVRVLLSKVNVSDGEWHTLALARFARYITSSKHSLQSFYRVAKKAKPVFCWLRSLKA